MKYLIFGGEKCSLAGGAHDFLYGEIGINRAIQKANKFLNQNVNQSLWIRKSHSDNKIKIEWVNVLELPTMRVVYHADNEGFKNTEKYHPNTIKGVRSE